MELDKSYVREHILEGLRELLPRDEMVSRSQTDALPNQSNHSRPAHFEKSISREEVAEQSGGAEVMPSSQVIHLAPVIVPAVTRSLMSPMVLYSILAFLLIVVIWFVVTKYWN